MKGVAFFSGGKDEFTLSKTVIALLGGHDFGNTTNRIRVIKEYYRGNSGEDSGRKRDSCEG